MKKHLILALACLITCSALAQQAKTVTLQNQPASVVKTLPQAGDAKVDPNLKEITVTFSKDMQTNRMWSVCQISSESFPSISGQIHYQPDRRTCVIPVTLEPGKTYVLWFNRAQFNAFRDPHNIPSVPYQLVFSTRP